MKKLAACLLAVVFVLVGAGLALAVEVTGVKVVESGIFKYVSSRQTGTTPQGVSVIAVRGYKLVKSTQRVPAVLGTVFGFSFMLNGQPKGYRETFLGVVTCPGLHVPGKHGVVRRTAAHLKYIIGKKHYFTWEFTRPWEVVPGKWTLQLVYKGKVMAQKSFVVYKP